MKLKTILPAGLFAAIVALSMGAQAASDTAKAAEAKAPAASMPADKKMKPDSHMEGKTGMPQHMSAVAEGKPAKAKTDKDRHLHPRDGK